MQSPITVPLHQHLHQHKIDDNARQFLVLDDAVIILDRSRGAYHGCRKRFEKFAFPDLLATKKEKIHWSSKHLAVLIIASS